MSQPSFPYLPLTFFVLTVIKMRKNFLAFLFLIVEAFCYNEGQKNRKINIKLGLILLRNLCSIVAIPAATITCGYVSFAVSSLIAESLLPLPLFNCIALLIFSLCFATECSFHWAAREEHLPASWHTETLSPCPIMNPTTKVVSIILKFEN